MKAKQGFDAAILRAEHFLTLYDLLRDIRRREVPSPWAAKFKKLMHWPTSETIVRVDGKKSNSILILREEVGIGRQYFTHDYVCELLRAAVVAAVSALDRYLHDLITDHSWKLLSRSEKRIPKELGQLPIPALVTKRALKRLRADSKARPGHLVKKAVQEHLHRAYTFQKPDSVIQAAKMLGVKNFWDKVAGEMPDNPSNEDVIDQLRAIAERRNQIVHEADLVLKTKAKKLATRDLKASDARDWVQWITDFAAAVDTVVTADV